MKKLLKELCHLNGISGNEDVVREYIISKVKDNCEYKVDNIGNLICFCKGRKSSDKKLMIAAHMDEVGGIVTYIREDGSLCFDQVGGVNTTSFLGKQVIVGYDDLYGVVGSKAVHNLSADEREAVPKYENLYIDIGSSLREGSKMCVRPGYPVNFVSEFTEFGRNCIRSKAIDDRAGCAMMIKLINEKPEYDTYFVFNVQEEVGLRGAKVSANSVMPDFAIVLEATTACDIPGVPEEKQVCALGKGPVVSYMDKSTIYDRELYDLAYEIALDNGIRFQTKSMIAGGNDSGAIHVSGNGVRTLAVSVPCRYIHSPSCVINYLDLEDSLDLVRRLIRRIHTL